MSLLGPLAYVALSIAVVLRSMPPAGALIEGRVTGTKGVPITGASVWLREAGIPEGMEEQGSEPAAKTDADGHFRLTGLTAGAQVHLRIEHAGYASLEVPGVEAPTQEALQLTMKTARGLAGRVLGPDGEPVAGAALTKGGLSLSDASLSMSDRPVLARTDAQGGFRIGGLDPGPFDLRITSRDYATQTVHGISIPQDRDLEGFEIVLDRGTVLEVRVLSPEGTPVSNTVVGAMPKDLSSLTLADLEQMEGLSGTTDNRGIVRITVPRPAPWRVVASTQGSTVAALVQAGQGTTTVELRFPPGAEVSGRVTDPQGRGIGNASVALTAEPNDPQSTMSGEDGAFVFQQVSDGVFRLTARRLGFVESAEPREVAVAGKGVRDLVIQLEPKPGVTLTGHLLGLKPGEIQAATVHAFGDQGLAAATVAPDGRYEIRDLQQGDWNVMVTAGTRSLQQRAQIQAGDSSPVLDIDFGKGFTLTGRVAMDGAPVSGALVHVMSPPSGQVSAQTNYEGRFVVRNLSPGPHVVMVLATRGFTGTGQAVDVEGDTEVTIDIPAGVLLGRVVSAGTGEPVSGATVQITPQGQEQQQITPAFSIATIYSGADGHFESRLADGTYQILVQKEGYAPAKAMAEVRHDMAGAVVEIRLKPLGAP